MKINFEGGDLSSDAGLLLIREFAVKIGLVKLIYSLFHTNDTAAFRLHTDPENLLQMIYQTIVAYFEDDCADELTVDPVFTAILEKEALASQPTFSRFFSRMDAVKWKISSRKAKRALVFLLSAAVQKLSMQTGSSCCMRSLIPCSTGSVI